ncbi:hypothetical protein Q664_04535 [Archangium violaceum Cb vi76]|uniref:Uncharacterized protein n=2 Tax=Archangium violaceum TaxID=83451 RepID=A0A084T0F8_9BACT|nr:hypothetical protein Q664_04535 [Archangium violaceum Cb vi76]
MFPVPNRLRLDVLVSMEDVLWIPRALQRPEALMLLAPEVVHQTLLRLVSFEKVWMASARREGPHGFGIFDVCTGCSRYYEYVYDLR